MCGWCGQTMTQIEQRNTRHLTLYGTVAVVGQYLLGQCGCGRTTATWTRRELTPRSTTDG